MARRLTTTSYALLGLLATSPMSAYDLAQQYPRAMRWNWPLSQAHLYSEPKRLAADGLVRIERQPIGPKRSRQVFHITAAGRRALRAWLGTTDVEPPSLNHELLLRVSFADQGDVDDLVAALDDAADRLAEIATAGLAQLRGYLDDGGPFPDRLHLAALLSDFHSRLLAVQAEWIADVRDEVARWTTTENLGMTDDARQRLTDALDRTERTLQFAAGVTTLP